MWSAVLTVIATKFGCDDSPEEDVRDKFLPSKSVKVPTWLETGVILSSQVTAVFVVPVEVPEEQ